MFYEWRRYVSVTERRRNAARAMGELERQGHPVSPVVIDGRTIARTFWGRAWCENLERYSDFANRLPRGRTYVRNGSVVDLQIGAGSVVAMVSGSELYRVEVQVSPVPKVRWKAIRKDCAGAIDSLVELLQGRFSRGVMERICRPTSGLFPAPAEIEFSCSCPDWASMCKHVAAVLYGVGARFDARPELLFALRQVDENDLIAAASRRLPVPASQPADRILAADDLSQLFGLEMTAAEPSARAKRARGGSGRKTAARAPRAKKRGTAAGKAKAASKPRAKSKRSSAARSNRKPGRG